jgi:hypothetical protein
MSHAEWFQLAQDSCQQQPNYPPHCCCEEAPFLAVVRPLLPGGLQGRDNDSTAVPPGHQLAMGQVAQTPSVIK